MEYLINCIRRAGHYALKFLVLSVLKITIKGKENVPDIPKALIVANHSSYLDVLVVAYPLFKQGLKTRWVISKSNYHIWYLKWLYFLWNVIVLNGTVEKIKHALEKDRWVIIFPEGNERWCPPNVQKKKRPGKGAAVVALSTGVTVIPIGIVGADKVLSARSSRLDPRYKIIVNVGKPFSYDVVEEERIGSDLLNSTIADMMSRIKVLIDEVS